MDASTPSFALSSNATPTVAGSLVVHAGACALFGFNASSTVSGYVMLFDATAVPADGAVSPRKTYAVSANQTLELAYDVPLSFVNGVILVFSTTGPFTKTISNTAFLSGDYR